MGDDDRPIWYYPVPRGFWNRRTNRRAYMEWLEKKLDIRTPEDWYVLDHKLLTRLGGQGLLRRYRSAGSYILEMLRDYEPFYDWKPWLFPVAPKGFWTDPENCRSYMKWLGEELGFQEPDDWYQVRNTDFELRRGRNLVRRLGGYVNAVKFLFPGREWHEWKFAHVPTKFWDDPQNCHRYLDWLGEQLGFKETSDWYRLRAHHLFEHYGATLITRQRGGILPILKFQFPDYPWREWRLAVAPQHFWDDPANCRRYLEWLGEKLGYRKAEDWYQLSRRDLADNYGQSLLKRYVSAQRILNTFFPEHEWHEWLFISGPIYFWDELANCRRYLEWLGKQLGFESFDDWYQVRTEHFIKHRGEGLLSRFGGSLVDVVTKTFEEHEWHEWRFMQTPKGFWDDPVDRRRYLDWLAEQLGYEGPEDWYQVRAKDFLSRYGATIWRRFTSRFHLLSESYPEYDWKEWLFRRVDPAFWKDRTNRLTYLEWLGRQLGIREPEEWNNVTVEDFVRHRGSGLIAHYRSSIRTLFRENFPEGHPAQKYGRRPAQGKDALRLTGGALRRKAGRALPRTAASVRGS